MILRHKFIQRGGKQKHLTLTISPEHLHSQLPPGEASFARITIPCLFVSSSYLPPGLFRQPVLSFDMRDYPLKSWGFSHSRSCLVRLDLFCNLNSKNLD
jgi:hypothetical protein